MECDRKRCKIAQQCSCKCASKASVPYCSSKKKLKTLANLIELLENCLAEFWAKDSDLIENKVYEPVISGRFAMIIFDVLNREYHLDEKLRLDIEYSKHWSKKKNVEAIIEHIKHGNHIDSKSKELIDVFENNSPNKNVRPDIVLHERKNDENNFFVMELKYFCEKINDLREEEKHKYDYAKLIILTYPIEKSNSEKSFYGYKYGIHLNICKDGALIQIFHNAHKIHSDCLLKKSK